jgi:hypothetical protein
MENLRKPNQMAAKAVPTRIRSKRTRFRVAYATGSRNRKTDQTKHAAQDQRVAPISASGENCKVEEGSK